MQIKVISDTHNKHKQLELGSGDVLIHCGDATNQGKLKETEAFLFWLARQHFKYKIFVPGNHDRLIRSGRLELRGLAHRLGIVYLDKEYHEIEGVKFYGNGYTPSVDNETGTFRDWHPTHVRVDAWESFSDKVDVLITHAPPQYILDTNIEGQHLGCDILASKVKHNKPKYHVFGHVHEHGGETAKVWDTTFYNCACLSREHLLKNHYREIIID